MKNRLDSRGNGAEVGFCEIHGYNEKNIPKEPCQRFVNVSFWASQELFNMTRMTNEEASGDIKYRNADRPVQCKHWVRPRSAQYSYLYDYRRNYYDDILDYLDRRRRGIIRDIPRPQTWAERALRTYTQKLGTTENAIKARYDSDLIHRVHHSRVMHDYHTKDYFSKRFTMAVF